MSINANYSGNVERSEHYATTSPAAQVGDASTDPTRILAGFAFANTTGGAVTCQLIHRQGGTDYTVWVKSVATLETAVVDNIPVRLQSGDTLKALGGVGVTLTLSFIAAYPQGSP